MAQSGGGSGKSQKKGNAVKIEFTDDDIANMAFQSHLNYEMNESKEGFTKFDIGHQSSKPFLEHQLKDLDFDKLTNQLNQSKKKVLNIGHLTRLLTLSTENSAAARILSKELQQQNLSSICELDSIQTRVKAKRNQIQNQNNNQQEEHKSSTFTFQSVFDKTLREIPHLNDTFNYKPPPPGFQYDGKDPLMKNMQQPSPGLARMKVDKNPNAHLNQQQTGISLTNGNYMNVGNTDNMIPTWKKQELETQCYGPGSNQNQNQNNFYGGHFDGGNGNNATKKRQYDEGPGQNYQGPGTQYQPPFNAGNGGGQRKDNKFIDQVYQSYGNMNNLPPNVKNRVDRIIDQCDGDVDYQKLQKHLKKQGYDVNQYNKFDQRYDNRGRGPQDHMRIDPNGKQEQKGLEGFRTGLKQFKDDQKNENKKGLRPPDEDRRNGGQGYGAGQGGYGGQGYGSRQIPGGGGQVNNYYGDPGRFDNKEPKDERSATDKLFDNSGKNPGLSGRRRFVPPSKDGAATKGTNMGAGFDPGRSVVNHMVNGQTMEKKEEDAKKELDPDAEPEDERLKNLDPKMVEMIEQEIMERDCKLTWDDIAGLEFAKKTINEIIIWPMLRPDIFKGIRAPPRGIMFFGPPGTGKTLLGKAIACQSKSTFMSISASVLTSKWVGEGEKLVKTMFAIATIHQPTVVFIDEIDSLLCARSESDQESSRRIKTEFLVQLDGANTFGGEEARILIIGATNRPDDLDEAVRRRLGKRLYIPLPNAAGRRQFLERMIEKEFLNDEELSKMIDLSKEDIDKLIELTIGYSGSDLKMLSSEAAMMPLREIKDVQNCEMGSIRPLKIKDFEDALKNVRQSVNQKDLQKFMDWNDSYGSYPIRPEDLAD